MGFIMSNAFCLKIFVFLGPSASSYIKAFIGINEVDFYLGDYCPPGS
jgi:hypothetical protein